MGCFSIVYVEKQTINFLILSMQIINYKYPPAVVEDEKLIINFMWP